MRYEVGERVIYEGHIRKIRERMTHVYFLEEDPVAPDYGSAAHRIAFEEELSPVDKANKDLKHLLDRYDD